MKDKKKRKEILNKIASPKQIKMLKFIKDKCDVKFKGKTTKELYDFIGKWYPRALKMAEIEKAIGKIGVTAYRARKTYHGNDIHGEWEELENNRDAVAHEKFKSDIIRGRNATDALIDFCISSRIEKMLDNCF